jgi:hypothetical protein
MDVQITLTAAREFVAPDLKIFDSTGNAPLAPEGILPGRCSSERRETTCKITSSVLTVSAQERLIHL